MNVDVRWSVYSWKRGYGFIDTYMKVCAVTSISQDPCIRARTASYPLPLVFMDKDSFAPLSFLLFRVYRLCCLMREACLSSSLGFPHIPLSVLGEPFLLHCWIFLLGLLDETRNFPGFPLRLATGCLREVSLAGGRAGEAGTTPTDARSCPCPTRGWGGGCLVAV